MNKLLLLKLEHQLLANPLKFDISSFMSSEDKRHWNIKDITMEQLHSCGTSACIIGHLATIVGFGYYSKDTASWVAHTLAIQDKQKLYTFTDACSMGCPPQVYWEVNNWTDVTNLMAADLIRHMRLHDTVPPSFEGVEKFYTLVEVLPPYGSPSISYLAQNKSLQNIIGVGTDAIQATADYSEQCANYLALVEGLDVAHISATL